MIAKARRICHFGGGIFVSTTGLKLSTLHAWPLIRLIPWRLLGAVAAMAKSPATPAAPKNTAELRQRIEKILQETETPGIGLAIVKRAGPEWIGEIGLAEVGTWICAYRWASAVVMAIGTAYLAYWGIIGWKTWA
jgi:hypothetical protein